MDSFVPSLHHSNHLQTHCLALLPYMSKIQPASQPDVPYKSGNLWMLVCPHNLSPILDIDNSTLINNSHNYSHMPGRDNTVYCSKNEPSTHYVYPQPVVLHHPIFTYPNIIKTTIGSKHLLRYGKPEHDKYIICKFLHMAVPREALE